MVQPATFVKVDPLMFTLSWMYTVYVRRKFGIYTYFLQWMAIWIMPICILIMVYLNKYLPFKGGFHRHNALQLAKKCYKKSPLHLWSKHLKITSILLQNSKCCYDLFCQGTTDVVVQVLPNPTSSFEGEYHLKWGCISLTVDLS